ncbi:ABC-2 family transporter protein [Candidatus Gottesmanbacteria bacterium]|nr:ABC-2 family transporter protein [Candidatus Gottesmanbacteria bacterium]
MSEISRYFKIWLKMSSASFETFFVSRVGAVLFLTGKIARFLFFFVFLLILVRQTKALAGYDIWQVILFYLTFNFIDSATQMLFREVYQFRQKIISGSFDLLLVKPINTLFRSLFGWTDILDFITLIPLILMIIYCAIRISKFNLLGISLYFLMLANSLLIATSFHIIVLGFAILTTEIDHAIMIYRDFMGMGRFPINIYAEPLRSFVTFIIPVGIMMSFPVDALLQIITVKNLVISLGFGLGIFTVSIMFWRYSLKNYTSASS